MSNIIQEFKERRGLTPIKVFVHGPPAAGKSFLSKLLAKEYSLNVINQKDIFKDQQVKFIYHSIIIIIITPD